MRGKRREVAVINLLPAFIRNRFVAGSIRRHIALTMMQSGFEAGSMTLASLLVARWFGPELLGLLGMLLAGVQLITNMGEGFPLSIIRFVGREKIDNPENSASLGWRLAWFSIGITFAFALIVGVAAWGISGEASGPGLIILSILLATARSCRQAFDSLFRAVRSFKMPTVAGIICTGIMAMLIIIFCGQGYGVATYLTIMAAMTGLNTLALVWAYQRMFPGSGAGPVLSRPLKKEFMDYSWPLVFRGITAFLFLKVNIWILGSLATAADAGQFRLTDQFLTIPALIFSAIVTAIAPRIVEAQHKGMDSLSDLCARMYGLLLLLGLPVAGFFLFNGYFMRLAFPGFEMASTMLMLFAPATLIRGLSNAASLLLVQGGKSRAAFWLAFLPSLANIIFALLGYYLGGVMGLVIATAIVHFATYIVVISVTHWLFRLPFRIRFR